MIEYRPVKSAERTIRLLEVLAASPTKLTLLELQERMGYPRSSLYALVRTLRDLGWIEADQSGSRFGVGPHALRSGSAYLERDPVLPYASATLEEMGAALGHTVHLARRDGTSISYLATRESVVAVQCAYRVGRRLPAHVTALGQVLLAELTEAEVDELLPARLQRFTEHTLVNREDLHKELDAVRDRGWACEREQGTPGVACVAAAVSYRIPATDAVSCSLPVAELASPDRLDQVAEVVLTHSRRLAGSLRRAGVR